MSNDSPLHIAVKNNNIDLVKMLLESQCDVHAVNAEGLTPLQLATQTGNTEIVALLLQHGAGRQAAPTPPLRPTPSIEGAVMPQVSPNRRRGSLQSWMRFYLISLAITMCTSGIGIVFPPAFLISLVSGICYGIAFYYFTVKLWEEIPMDIARSTPKKAAGYSFIPIFNIYWNFVAFHGLTKDMNKTALRLGKSEVVNCEKVKGICFFWAVYSVVSVIAAFTAPAGGTLVRLIVLDAVFVYQTWTTMQLILKGMDELIAAKAN